MATQKNYQKMTPAEITARVEKLYKERQSEEMLRLLEQGIKVPASSIDPFIKEAVIAAFRSPRDLKLNSKELVNNVNFETHVSSLMKIANFTPAYRNKFWNGFKDMQNQDLNSSKKVEMEKKRAFFETSRRRKKLRKYLAEQEYIHAQNQKEQEEKKKKEEAYNNSIISFWVKDVLARKKELTDLLKILYTEKQLKKELAEYHLSHASDKNLKPQHSISKEFQTLFLEYMKDFEAGKIKNIPQMDFLMAYAYLSSLEPGQKTKLTEAHISFPELKHDITYAQSTTVTALLDKELRTDIDINLFTALIKNKTLQLLEDHQINNEIINSNDNLITDNPEFSYSSNKTKSNSDNELGLVELARENNMSSAYIAQIQAINSLIESISSNNNLNQDELKSLEATKERLTGLISNFNPAMSSTKGNFQKNRAINQSGNSKKLKETGNNIVVSNDISSELSNISKELIRFQEEYYMNSSENENNNTKKIQVRNKF